MRDMTIKKLFSKSTVPVVLACVILVLMALITSKNTRRLITRSKDLPPTIEFTWAPAGPVDLREMKGFLTLKDDYAIDFTTYRLTIDELHKTIDLPIPGMIGKEYSSPISFSFIANDPRLLGLQHITVMIDIADDRGQKSSLTRNIDLKQ